MVFIWRCVGGWGTYPRARTLDGMQSLLFIQTVELLLCTPDIHSTRYHRRPGRQRVMLALCGSAVNTPRVKGCGFWWYRCSQREFAGLMDLLW
ncbi:hypothetical protein BJ165DRAFT_1516554 [Panaeolus papilionaceus]|nr:hypothetical protein BJ165DRAFT_1516554 [Panaeolus papilionaceus]